MRSTASKTLKILTDRIARLEAKFLRQCQGIKGFHKFISAKVEEAKAVDDQEMLSRLLKLRGIFSSKVESESSSLGFSRRKLSEAIEHLDEIVSIYERAPKIVSGQTAGYERDVGLARTQTVLSSPLKEAQIVLNESIKKPKQDLEEARVKIEEAIVLIDGIRRSFRQV